MDALWVNKNIPAPWILRVRSRGCKDFFLLPTSPWTNVFSPPLDPTPWDECILPIHEWLRTAYGIHLSTEHLPVYHSERRIF